MAENTVFHGGRDVSPAFLQWRHLLMITRRVCVLRRLSITDVSPEVSLYNPLRYTKRNLILVE